MMDVIEEIIKFRKDLDQAVYVQFEKIKNSVQKKRS